MHTLAVSRALGDRDFKVVLARHPLSERDLKARARSRACSLQPVALRCGPSLQPRLQPRAHLPRQVSTPTPTWGSTHYGSTHYGSTHHGSTHYGSTHYGSTHYGSTHYGSILTHCCHILTTTLPTMVQADFAAYGIALTFTPCALREVARRAATQGTGAT